MINQENRLCYDCKYLLVLDQEPGWSEYTPGRDASIECLKGHWGIEFWQDNLGVRLRDGLRMARTCPDFEPV